MMTLKAKMLGPSLLALQISILTSKKNMIMNVMKTKTICFYIQKIRLRLDCVK